MKYYGVTQSNHGADHVYLFTEEQIKKEFESIGYDIDTLPQEQDEKSYESFWPIGGSNCSDSVIELFESDEQILAFLTREALGPDSADPVLVDIAEYYYRIEDEGCAHEFLKAHGYDVEQVEQNAILEIEKDRDIIKKIGIENCYEDNTRDIRMSDVYLINMIKDELDALEAPLLDYDESGIAEAHLSVRFSEMNSKFFGYEYTEVTLEITIEIDFAEKEDSIEFQFYNEDMPFEIDEVMETDESREQMYLENLLTNMIEQKARELTIEKSGLRLDTKEVEERE